MRNNVVDYYRALAVTLDTVYHIQMGLGMFLIISG